MRQATKAGIAWNGLLESVAKHVRAWRPPMQTKEIEYSRALAEYLRAALPAGTQIEREYRHLGETLDVYVRYSGIVSGDEIFVEVKRRLNRKAELNRLIGQASSLNPDKNKVLIVLVGICDVELVGRLRNHFRQYLEGGPLIATGPSMRVVEVPEAENAL